jgi:hypothetical protein
MEASESVLSRKDEYISKFPAILKMYGQQKYMWP